MKVRFKVRTLDLDTRIEYPISDVFVEVSDAFAKRLKDYDPKGEMFEFETKKEAAEPKAKPVIDKKSKA